MSGAGCHSLALGFLDVFLKRPFDPSSVFSRVLRLIVFCLRRSSMSFQNFSLLPSCNCSSSNPSTPNTSATGLPLRVTTTRSRRASLMQTSNVACSSPMVFIDTYLGNVEQNDSRNIYRAKTPSDAPCHFDPFDKAQDKLREKSVSDPSHSFRMTDLSPSLGVFASLRESSVFRFCSIKLNREFQIRLVRISSVVM